MFRINGTGIAYLGPEETEKSQNFFATVWITFLYLPLIPLGRNLIQVLNSNHRGLQYNVIQKETLNFKSILKTYLTGWVLVPMMMLWPLPIAIKEVYNSYNLPTELYDYAVGFMILWLVASGFFLKRWSERRWLKSKAPTP